MDLTGGAFRKIGFMPIDTKLLRGLSSVSFLPVTAALRSGLGERKCPVIDDLGWVMAGVTRALATVASGRDFLQSVVEDVASAWNRRTYIEALKSPRRLGLLRRINEAVCQVAMPATLPDRLAAVPGLDKYDVYAGDGHWHEHATHDPRRGRKGGHGPDKDDKTHVATGHVFGLNLRTRGIVHLAHCDEETKIKEHDMGVLKRLDRDVLRQGAPKGRKVIWILSSGEKRRRVRLVLFMLLQLRKQYIKRNGRDCHFSRGGTTVEIGAPPASPRRRPTS